MNKKAILITGLVLGIIGLVIPALAFWAIAELTGHTINYGLSTFASFWILIGLAKGSISRR